MTASLTLARPDPELLAEVPLSAIFQQGKEPAVWVVDKATGTVSLRPVTISRWRDETALIASGVDGRRDRRHRRRPQARAGPEGEAGPGRERAKMSARGPNLSELALKNSTLTLFFMLVLTAAGVFAYFNLGRAEDPPFTIKQMVVSAQWPGATSREMEQQVTDKLETKLQELPYFYNVQSYTKPGETVIYVSLRDDVPPAKVPDLWYQVRKKIGDIRGHACRRACSGPNFNDEYGDTYSLIWAFEADGFSDAEVKAMVKEARLRLLRVPDVTKADLFGVQDEKIYIEFSHARLAMLGVPVDQILDVVRKQNAIAASGTIETKGERMAIRVDGAPTSAEQLMALPFSAAGRTLTLGDVAEIKRGYTDPRQFSMRFNGKPVIGLGVVMQAGGNVQVLGKALDTAMDGDRARPAGRHHRPSRRQPARGGRGIGARIHPVAGRGARHRAGRVVHQPGLPHRHHRGAVACRWCWPSPSSA